MRSTTVGEGDRAFRALRRHDPRSGPGRHWCSAASCRPSSPTTTGARTSEYPRTAGRSSQLFNTGTAAWAYRCVIEGLCGLRGHAEGLLVKPQLPSHWHSLSAEREFRGARFKLQVRRTGTACVLLDGEPLADGLVRNIEPGREYQLEVELG